MDHALSSPVAFADVDWERVPDAPGVYVISDRSEVIYVGMAGRNGKGSLRRRLKDHASGQVVNMFAQYLFLDRVQFVPEAPVRHPREAARLVREYVRERCAFQFRVCQDGRDARELEQKLKRLLAPSLNG